MPTRPPLTPALQVTNLRVDYGSFTAVRDFNLTLMPGEIFGLAGPNGAGKTSTIRVLATLMEPTYGEVTVMGRNLFEVPDAVHAVLGYMPDLAPVIPDLRVWEFLDLYAHSHGFRGTEKRDRVDSCLVKVKLDDKRDLYGRELSRGMTQRVVLAKTLLHDPKLLLLDEPASGMDPIARRDLRHILQELAAAGATVLVSSHILSELADMCTSVGIMHLGDLLRHGSMESVIGSLEGQHVEVDVELFDAVEKALALLAFQPGVAAIRVDGMKVTFKFSGDRQARAQLLRHMIAEGAAVSAFTPRKSGIEALLVSLVEDR